MDTIQAAVLLAKMEVFEDELKTKNQVAAKYTELLKDSFTTPVIPENAMSAYAQYTVLAKNQVQRDAIVEGMKNYDIPIMVYYAVPMHKQTAYKYLNYKDGDLPVCEDFSKRVFSLPMHAYLTDEEIKDIAEKIKQF